MIRGIKSRKHPALPGMLSAALLFVKLEHELLADFQLLDDRAVALDIDFLEVIKQGFALAYEKNERTLGALVFGLLLEVLCQVLNTECKQSNLTFWRPGVSI